MSVPKGKRNESRFEAQHHFFKLRDEITLLILNDFGFSEEKYLAKMNKYRENHQNAENVEEVVERWQKKNDSFNRWFIDEEGRKILEILRNINENFTMGNSIYPSQTPAKLFEFVERRKYMNRAIGYCFTLKQEIQYVLRVLPVDINKYERFAEAIDEQIALYKGVRKADNNLLKRRKGKPNELEEKATTIYDLVATAIREIGKAEEEDVM